MVWGIRKIVIEGEEWVRVNLVCFVGNISDFFVFNDFMKNFDFNEMDYGDFFFECIMYEEIEGVDEIGNIFIMNKLLFIELVYGWFFFNIEKGDIMEENVD